MNRKKIILSAAALILLIGFSIKPALAYFTCHTAVEGAVTVHMSNVTTFDEPEVKNWKKHLVVKNKGTAPCYVRATAYAASKFKLTYEGTGWSDGKDGYWYYDEIVEPGDSTPELLVKIGNVPEKAEIGEDFHVAVIYESVPVRYDEKGKAFADWEHDLTVVEE